jgi:deoxycytidylate deaminase
MQPSWDEYYIGWAWWAKERSPDETKHGCVLVNKDMKEVGTGYNGYPRKIDPPAHLRERPHKLKKVYIGI